MSHQTTRTDRIRDRGDRTVSGDATAADRTARGTALGRSPSNDVRELAKQLLRELDRLDNGADSAAEKTEALRLVQAYLEHAQVLAWRGVAVGDLDAPRRILDPLLAAEPFADAHLSQPSPEVRAAAAVRGTLESLHVASEALEKERTRVRLADRKRSGSEREVLRVLAGGGPPLRRGQVHERLDMAKKPTPARVGQILADLYHQGLLRRIPATAQGNRTTAFYELSGLGRELASSLGLEVHVPEEVDEKNLLFIPSLPGPDVELALRKNSQTGAATA